MSTGIARENLRLRNLQGSLFTFDDVALMTRACGRITQVMVFGGRTFTLKDAIGDRNVAGATILKADVQEFTSIFDITERSNEEYFMLELIGDHDFAIAMHTPERNPGLLSHELSHVLFYYDLEYRKQVTSFWDALDEAVRQEMVRYLKKSGYEDIELVDEWFAHLLYGFDDKKGLLDTNPDLSAFQGEIEKEFCTLHATVQPMSDTAYNSAFQAKY